MTGMLWFDNSNRPLEVKIGEAVKHYRAKYKSEPTVCQVSIDAEGNAPNGILLERSRSIAANHFFIGRDSSPGGKNVTRPGA